MYRLVIVAALAAVTAGWSKSETAQARSREGAPLDQVTISSEADGKVSRILADLGDRVKAGQVLIQIDNEKQQYTFEQQ